MQSQICHILEPNFIMTEEYSPVVLTVSTSNYSEISDEEVEENDPHAKLESLVKLIGTLSCQRFGVMTTEILLEISYKVRGRLYWRFNDEDSKGCVYTQPLESSSLNLQYNRLVVYIIVYTGLQYLTE
jgi:hypothetical protein